MSSQARERMESLVLVTVITVLVWLYAEGEVVKTYKEPVPVQFVAPTGSSVVVDPEGSTNPDGVMSVQVTFRASAGQMQAVRRAIAEGSITITVEPSSNAATSREQDIALRDRLMASRLGQLGVNIADVDPVTATVWVEPMQQVTVPITLETPRSLSLAAPPTIEPPQATLQVPANFSAQAQNGQVEARLDPARLRKLEPGQAHILEVGLALPDWLDQQHVTFEPKTARVSLNLDTQIEQTVLRCVPIRINAPAPLLEQYAVRLRRDQAALPRLEIAGPANVIERIRAGRLGVWAELHPRLQQIEAGRNQLKPHIHRPPEVSVVSELPNISIQLERRSE